jgi:hypothetical protein
METKCVYCAVRTQPLNTVQDDSAFSHNPLNICPPNTSSAPSLCYILPTAHFPSLHLHFSTLHLATSLPSPEGQAGIRAVKFLFPPRNNTCSAGHYSLSLSLSPSLSSLRKLNMVLGTAVSTVYLPVKVTFTLEEVTKAQRGSRDIALLFPQPRR